MDNQLCTQFMTCPFMIDPYSTTYIQLLECSRMDSFLTHVEKAQHTFENQWAARTSTPCSSQSENRYAPYDKDAAKGGHLESFRKTKKPILCLQCGYTSHRAGNCSSTQSNFPKHPIACDWKLNKLLSKSNKLICIMYNVRGSCSNPAPNHSNHSSSLCSNGSHPACRCPRN